MSKDQAEKSRYREDCTLWACASVMGAEPVNSLAQMVLESTHRPGIGYCPGSIRNNWST